MRKSDLQSSQPVNALALRLPELAVTRGGIQFQPNDDVWDWTDGPFHVYLDYRKVNGNFVHLREPLKRCLLVFAKSSSASHLYNLFQAFQHFLATRNAALPFTTFSVAEVSGYSARLAVSEQWRLTTLNALLQKWNALSLPGVDADCTQYLRERRKPGNQKGTAVRTRDPFEGPFSEDEYTALYKAVDAAYGTDEIPMWVAVLTRLLYACGGRISQYASLKLIDFSSSQGAFVIRLPQAKTRGAHSRVHLKDFDLSPQTGRLVQAFVDQMLSQGQVPESPMFHEGAVMKKGRQKQSRPPEDLFFGHCTANELSRIFTSEIHKIAPPAERLDFDTLPVTPKRFRYTFGTRLAEEGASKAVIADRLGHVDLQHVDVYFEASPKIVDNIDKAIGAMLSPLARAFRGRLVENEEHSTQKGAPGSRIIDFRVSTTPLASCSGNGQGCEFNKPVACYTCFKFEPWLDAPHEKVLQRLEAEREKFIEDPRISRVNDDAIQAAREIIAECVAVRAQRAGRSAS